MSETANYHLYVTDDDTEKFYAWRKAMNGVNNSNMTKIDEALAGKSNKSVHVDCTLAASAWADGEQSIQHEAITEAVNGTIGLSQTATAQQRDAARKAVLYIKNQTNGSITIALDGKVPAVDIPVVLVIDDAAQKGSEQ